MAEDVKKNFRGFLVGKTTGGGADIALHVCALEFLHFC